MIALLLLFACKGTSDDSAGGEPVSHCGEITADETWSATNNPHTLTCDVTVAGGTLTIEAGVEVVAYPGVSLEIATGGAASGLLVQGSASEPVTFRPGAEPGTDSAEPGPWGGLRVLEGTIAPSIAYASLEGAEDPILRVQGVELYVEELTLRDGAGTGLLLEEGARFAEGSSALTVTGCDGAAVDLGAEAVHTLPAGSYTGNALDQITVQAGRVDEEATWENLGVPFVVSGDVHVEGSAEFPASLEIAAGTTLRFANGRALIASPNGGGAALRIGAPGGATVHLEALDGEERGAWDGVYARSGTRSVEIYETNISLGGLSGDAGAALYVEGNVELVLNNVEISGSASDGIYLVGGASISPQSSDINVSDCTGYPLTIEAALAHTAVPGTFEGNDTDGVRVLSGTLDQSVSWEALGVPYVLTGRLRLEGDEDYPAVLTLEPGTEILLDVGASVNVAEAGGAAGLIAAGTADAPVQLRSLRADQDGFWGGVRAYAGTEILSFTETVLDGGGGDQAAMLHVEDTSVDIHGLTLANSRDFGVELSGDASFAEGSEGLNLDANYDQIRLGAGALHTLPVDLRFLGQTSGSSNSHGFQVVFVTSESSVRGSVRWGGLSDGAVYWIEDRIALDGTAEEPSIVTIDAGTTWWMGDSSGLYVSAVSGGAAGLFVGGPGEATVFTAGEAESAGRWYGIRIGDHCLDDSVRIENTTISYAGRSGDRFTPAGIFVEGCAAQLQDVTVDHSAADGLFASGAMQVVDSDFTDNADCGTMVSAFEGVLPTLTNIYYADNGYGDACAI